MGRGPSNCGRGPDLTACLVGLQSHSQLRQGCCLTRTGPKYVGSLVYTESLGMNVGYTNSFSKCFFVNTYDTVHIVLIKIHIIFTIAYNTYWACGGFFSRKSVTCRWSIRYGASQCGPLNNALNPTLGLKTSFIALISRYIPLHTIGANHFYKGGNQKWVPFWFLQRLESFVTPPLNS